MFWGYLIASGIMLIGAAVAAVWGVDAEGKSLEEIAPPLSSYRQGRQRDRQPPGLRRLAWTRTSPSEPAEGRPPLHGRRRRQRRRRSRRRRSSGRRLRRPRTTGGSSPCGPGGSPVPPGTTSGRHRRPRHRRARGRRAAEQAALEADVAEVLGADHGAPRSGRSAAASARCCSRPRPTPTCSSSTHRAPSPAHPCSRSGWWTRRPAPSWSCRHASRRAPSPLERAGRAVGRAAVRSAGLAGRPGYRPPMAHG